ncbi:hypothetical protein BDW22DRAFT_441359 [Trametopsis cervina]|nr:hypothetical protein BDW22DRAFT_441359 [Trametopsis cervina]
MPKAAPNTETSKSNAPSLKRYQACHQCRKRKLKCDAKRPCCSTCARSHAYAVSHAVEGAVFPPHPECTYDEDAGNSVSRKMYEKMELRSWPPNLPTPDVTRHLVEAFFAYHIHASRLFHAPTFMASLDLLPTDPRFPHVSVLHAMCAVGSLYTAAVPESQMFCDHDDTPYELQGGRWKKAHHRPDMLGDPSSRESFSEQQARYARRSCDVGLIRAEFQCVQAQIILTWWYLSQGRWTDAFLSAAQAMRCTGPCSISTCYTTAAITHYKPPSVLPPAKSVIEDEIRRNTFWIAYSMERQQGTGNGWALSLDDLDVCQLLPLRGDQFEQGILVLPEGRQWSYAPDILYKHPEHQTDSFILYVKSAILLSRVKTFNLRFRWRPYNPADNSILSPQTAAFDPTHFEAVNSSPEFQQLDEIIDNFRPSFPARLRSPVANDVLDPYLYTACTATHLAHILLHEPHAKPDVLNCTSAAKTLCASRAIVELMYTIGATNYDITLLDLQVMMCWFMAGRVLVRFLRAAIDTNDHDQVIAIQGELSYVRMMLGKAGERVPLAFRYGKMLNDTLVNMCGDQFSDSIPSNLPPRGHYVPTTPHPMAQPIVDHILL